MACSTYYSVPFQICRWLLNTLFHQAVAVVAVYAIWIACQYYSSAFSLHVILCTLGIIVFMAEALILYGDDNVWTLELEKEQKIWIHAGLMSLSFILIITGIALVVNRESGGEFSSAHGITGLVTMIFLIIVVIIGVLAYFSTSLKGYVRPVIIHLSHNIAACIAYIIGVVSLCLGYYTNWFEKYTTVESRMAATIVTAILCGWSLVRPFISAFKQIQNITYRTVPLDAMVYSRPVSFIEPHPS